MSLLNKLTIKNLKLNKKRTIVTIIGIILSVALITAVSTMYMSGISSLINFETYEKGDFHYSFSDVPTKDINTFKNNRKIESIYMIKHIGDAILEDSNNEDKPYAHIMELNDESLKKLSIKLVSGRFPKNDSEIIIPTHLKTNGRVFLNVGDTITLNVGKRVTSDGYKLNQSNPYYADEEGLIDTKSKTYTIVGIMERPATNIEPYHAPGYSFISHMDELKEDTVDIYARYTKEGLKNHYKVTADIIDVDATLYKKSYESELTQSELEEYVKQLDKSKYDTDTNGYLITLETNPLDNSSTGGLGTVALIVCGIIVFTSVFCIKNSFDISITEKTKQYGMLRSVGATKKQIRKNVFYEAFILGLIGIPLGIILGIGVSYILIIICNIFMKDMLTAGLGLQFSISLLAIIFSIILGIVTIYLSAIKSSKRASKISPIDSIRNSSDLKLNNKKLKTSKIVNKLFGVGGDISYKNLKRNRKKYRTTVISIIVSTSIFIALSSFVTLAFLSVKNELNMRDYNISLSAHTNYNDKFYESAINTVNLDNIYKYVILNQQGLNINNPKLSSEYKNLLNINESDDYSDSSYINIYSLGDKTYREYIDTLGLEYDNVKDKAILIDKYKVNVYDQKKKKAITHNVEEYSYKTRDIIKGTLSNGEESNFEIEVAVTTGEKPFGLKYMESSMIIVSDELYEEKLKDNKRLVEILYQSSNPDKLQDDIESALKGYDIYINNSEENAKIMRNLFTLVAIFLYGFIIVISLIGITNIFNTITTNMELRKQEFAMLKSIGMTKSEFSKMIRLESIFIGSKTLIFGIPIGMGLSYLIYYYLSKDSGISYPIPYKAIIISVLAVFVLITSLMKYSMNKINKQNTIETIRNENI